VILINVNVRFTQRSLPHAISDPFEIQSDAYKMSMKYCYKINVRTREHCTWPFIYQKHKRSEAWII